MVCNLGPIWRLAKYIMSGGSLGEFDDVVGDRCGIGVGAGGFSVSLWNKEVRTDVCPAPKSPSLSLGHVLPLPGDLVWDAALCHQLEMARAWLKDSWHQQGRRQRDGPVACAFARMLAQSP